MRSGRIEVLRLANRNLRTGLDRFRSARNTGGAIRPGDFSLLRNEVLRVANGLHSVSAAAPQDAELEKEISECRSHLQQLTEILPIVHVGLQARRGRLEAALGHLQAAAAWADASRKSL